MASLSDSTLQYGSRRRFNPARAVRVSSFASLRVLAMLRAPLENVRQNVRQRCRRTASDTQGQELQKCRSIEAFSKTRTYGFGRALVSFKAKMVRAVPDGPHPEEAPLFPGRLQQSTQPMPHSLPPNSPQ